MEPLYTEGYTNQTSTVGVFGVSDGDISSEFNITLLVDGENELWKSMGDPNSSRDAFVEQEREYIFDRLSVRVIFILLYTMVFCFCVFGNLLVIMVVTLHWRMRNITKFCLANLAFADFCVGIFCVYQNLSTYLINSWVLGEFLCKMYQFINALSHTASILILVVMCVERHLAILHPFRCKQLLTIRRLRILIVAVWIVSAIYCSPRLYYIVTLRVYRMDGGTEIICTAKRTLYDSRTFDMIHFFLLFLLPLFVITILYTRVGIVLWRTSKNRLPAWSENVTEGNLSRSSSGGTIHDESPSISRTTSVQTRSSLRRHVGSGKDGYHGGGNSSSSERLVSSSLRNNNKGSNNTRSSIRNGKRNSSASFVVTIDNKCHLVGPNETRVLDIDSDAGDVCSDSRSSSRLSIRRDLQPHSPRSGRRGSSVRAKNNNSPLLSTGSFRCGSSFRRQNSTRQSPRKSPKRLSTAKNLRSGHDALKSRQTVVRMLIVIVVTFAMCNFPFHLRKMFQYWWPNYDYVSVYSTLATPLTHLIMYANCAINPIIYAFMSKTFRSSFKDLLCCRLKKPSSHQGASHYHRRLASLRAAAPSTAV